MPRLGVNIDHVATLREARKTIEPDPVRAAQICEIAGADGIVAHLREDRRHIQERDLQLIKEAIRIPFNMEMAATPEMLQIAMALKVNQSTLVPEKRKEITTEGGLNVKVHQSTLKKYILSLKKGGIKVSLFIDPIPEQVEASKNVGADAVELHTGRYANKETREQEIELKRLTESASLAHSLNLSVHAGHGLNYENVKRVLQIPFIEELNIGHSIISRAVFVGLERAVKEMKELIRKKI